MKNCQSHFEVLLVSQKRFQEISPSVPPRREIANGMEYNGETTNLKIMIESKSLCTRNNNNKCKGVNASVKRQFIRFEFLRSSL